MYDQLLLVFIPPSGCVARVIGAGCFVYGQWERMLPIQPLSSLPRIPIETSPAVLGHPRREGSNHSITINSKCTHLHRLSFAMLCWAGGLPARRPIENPPFWIGMRRVSMKDEKL